MTRLRTALCSTLACLALVAAVAPAAQAARSQTTFFEAPAVLLNPVTRPATMATLQRLGVKALRVELSWHAVAPSPNSRRRPSFDATDPAFYHWDNYAALVEMAHSLGWTVLLTVTSPVPRWAEANPASRSLVEHPNTRRFQEFMTAVGRRFSSQAALYGIWNEPNHHEFLEPQFNRNGSPASPRIYRGLFQAGYAGLAAAGIVRPRVLFGETAPEGQPQGRRGANVGPLVFMRGALCLDSRYRHIGSCSPLPIGGYAIHPYASAAGPLSVPFNPESVTIGSLYRIIGPLDAAARAGALPHGLPLYITEFGVISKPNPYLGVDASVQAEYDAIAERVAFSNGRVASFSQYLLKDDPIRRRSVGFQSGLEYVNGRHKPLYSSFPVPLTVSKRGGGYSLWGLVRPAGEATTLAVELQRPHSSRWTLLARPRTDGLGYWTLTTSTPGSRWRVSWTSPQGVRYKGPPIRAR